MALHKVFRTTEKQQIGVFIITIFSILSSIITIYGLIKFWRLRDYPFIKKRHPSLVFVSSICLILILAIERPLSSFVRLSSVTSIKLQWIRWIIHVILFQTQIICVFFRIYITCFDVNFAKANAAQLWVKYIDSHSKCKKTSFIVSNYNKYANLYKIYWYIIVLICLTILTIIIVSIVAYESGFITNEIFFILYCCNMCVIWFYTPRYLDHFKIRVEIRIVLLIQCCLVVLNLAYFLLTLENKITYSQWFIIQCFAVCLLSMLSFTQTLWVLYKFSIAKRSRLTRDRQNSNSTAYSATATATATHQKQKDSWGGYYGDDNSKEILEFEIIDIIKEKIGFQAFMNHLNKEFSMENLLGVIEFTQYKTRYREIRSIKEDISNGIDPNTNRASFKLTAVMYKVIKSLSVGAEKNNPEKKEEIKDEIKKAEIKKDEIKKDEIKDEIKDETETETTTLKKSISQLKRNVTKINITEQLVELPNNMPYSTIVYGANYNCEDYKLNIENIMNLELDIEAKRIVNELFLKYIFVGSEMELNLSHRLRKRCLEKLSYIDEMDDTELEHMFDKSIASLLKLMQDSYLRFKETKEFIRYEEKAKKRIRNNSAINKENLGGIFGDLM